MRLSLCDYLTLAIIYGHIYISMQYSSVNISSKAHNFIDDVRALIKYKIIY